jgi:hypothetical protein
MQVEGEEEEQELIDSWVARGDLIQDRLAIKTSVTNTNL